MMRSGIRAQRHDSSMNQTSDKSATAAATSGDLEQLLRTASSAIFRILPQPLSENFEFYSIQSHRLARLAIYLSASDPFTVNRRRQDIEDDSAFDYLVLVQLEGSAEIEQRKSRFLVNPGSLAIIPGGLPYRLSFLQTGKRLLLRIPLGVFHERVLGRRVRDFGAHVFSGEGLVQIAIDLLKSLVVQAASLSETEQFTVAQVTLDLIAAVVRAETDFEGSQHGSAQVARMSRILSYLEEHFADHDLTPAKVAEANAVSTRHLHNLFQHSGLTVTRWIWERRLKAAREDLLNPALADLSITEIAYQRGFNDSAHFSRTFKSRFSISPSQLRKKIQQELLVHN
jgi:AraC-like DNA-binding protein